MSKVLLYVFLLLIMPLFPVNMIAAYYIYKNDTYTADMKNDMYVVQDFAVDTFDTIKEYAIDTYEENRSKITNITKYLKANKESTTIILKNGKPE